MEVTPEVLMAELEGKVLIDIRRAEEWQATGVIAGAHPLTFFDAAGNADPQGWLQKLAEFASPDDDLVLICRSGHRTGVILNFLRSQTPYQNARHLAGGMLAWFDRDLPTVSVQN